MNHKEIIQQVDWKDLKKLNRTQTLIENNISIPFFLGSMISVYYDLYWLATPFSIYYFLGGFRQAHNALHRTLGTNKFLTWLSLFLNSLSMMVSMHAIKFNHLRHHKNTIEENDFEGETAHLPWYKAIFFGPVHLFKVHKTALEEGNKTCKRNIKIELCCISVIFALAFLLDIKLLKYHVVVMLIGEFMMVFFAVWIVHRGTSDNPRIARTQRSRWKNLISLNMFYHMEHHLFPAVPAINLPALAERLDKSVPELEKKNSF